MKKILCITASMNTGGAETFLMKILRVTKREDYAIDFCVATEEKGFYDEEILSLGSKIFHICPKTHSFKKFKKDLSDVIKNGDYDAVFRSGATGFMAIDLWIAKKYGVKKRIFRSTNAGTTENSLRQFVNIITRRVLCSASNVKLAPSMLAAEYTFGKRVAHKKVKIINNGLDLEKFRYDEKVALEIKKELNVGEKQKVFGHIGRFSEQKNHTFLINLFQEYCKQHDGAVLILVGEGHLKPRILELIKEKHIEKKVIVLGSRTDVNKILMSFDVLLLPSIFEGMPNIVIESQCSGLPCLISNTITKDSNVTGLVNFLPIGENDYSLWLKKMETANRCKEKAGYYLDVMRESGYDIRDVQKDFFKAIFSEENK